MPADEYTAAQFDLEFRATPEGQGATLRDTEFGLEPLRAAWAPLIARWVDPLSPADRRAQSEEAHRNMVSWGGEPCPCDLCDLREPVQGADNVTDELMALVRAGDEARFRELAGCVMPVGEIAECWAGARARLGLPGPPVLLPPAGQEIAEIMQPLTEWAEGLQERPFDGRSITEMLGQYIYREGS